MVDQARAAFDSSIFRDLQNFGERAHRTRNGLLDLILSVRRETSGRQCERGAKYITQSGQQRVTGIFRPQEESDECHDQRAKQNCPDAPEWLIDVEGGTQSCEHEREGRTYL